MKLLYLSLSHSATPVLDKILHKWMVSSHENLSLSMSLFIIILIVAHAGAALQHHSWQAGLHAAPGVRGELITLQWLILICQAICGQIISTCKPCNNNEPFFTWQPSRAMSAPTQLSLTPEHLIEQLQLHL